MTRIVRALALILFFGATPLLAQRAAPSTPAEPPARADRVLQARLEGLVRGFHGDVGIYVRNLRTGAGAEIRADSVFPTASMIKVPILLTLFDQVESGKFGLEDRVAFPDTLHYRYGEATDVVGYMAPGDTLPLSEVAFLMLTVSDNFAALWLQGLVGGGAAVNEWLGSHGFRDTRVNSRTPGREAARSVYGWGQTTPREIAHALVMIRQGRAVSPRASEAMYRLLTNSYWKNAALAELPPTVQAASKQGFVDRSRSEVLLVNAPQGDYVLAIITKNQTDESYTESNEGWRLIRAVSRAVYQHFNPRDPWRPLR
ncbi:MAG TPA: serine hydrolase [Longimicrobium sp.]|nr:serine hydrolase [Longimicrobium sp.]